MVVVELYLMADATADQLEQRVAALLDAGPVSDAFDAVGLEWHGYGDVRAVVGTIEVDDGDDSAGATEPGRGN